MFLDKKKNLVYFSICFHVDDTLLQSVSEISSVTRTESMSSGKLSNGVSTRTSVELDYSLMGSHLMVLKLLSIHNTLMMVV